jgi:hypothetical protein
LERGREGGGSGVVTVESSDGKREREEEGKTREDKGEKGTYLEASR